MAEAGTAEAGTSVTPTIGDETGDTDVETAALCGEWPKLDSSIARAGRWGGENPGPVVRVGFAVSRVGVPANHALPE
jgi:hypothetical protein